MPRSSIPVAISFDPQTLEQADRLAAREGVSRSALVRGLVERASEKSKAPDVRVDGRRYVPARRT